MCEKLCPPTASASGPRSSSDAFSSRVSAVVAAIASVVLAPLIACAESVGAPADGFFVAYTLSGGGAGGGKLNVVHKKS